MRTSDKFLIEQIPILLLSRCDENEKYVITACRRIKYFAERTTVFEKVFEYLEDFSVSTSPAALKIVTAITVNANNKDNFKLAVRGCCAIFHIDYPSHIAAIREMLCRPSASTSTNNIIGACPKLKSWPLLSTWLRKKTILACAKAMTDMLFKALSRHLLSAVCADIFRRFEMHGNHPPVTQRALPKPP
ncbi:MAG: hypothetical protein ACLU99_08605 [Alphaproteobacteria bacterium]